MGAIGYYIFYSFNWVITLLPLSFLYIVSDFLYLLLYYFPTYRKKVVRENLTRSFPEKSLEEIKTIEKKFYHHLSDLIIEVLKLTHISEKELSKRFRLENSELLEKLYSEKRDIIAVMAHYNNWEWLTVFPLATKYKSISIYKPLHNKHFDELINHFRTRFGMVLTPMSAILRELINDRKNGINTLSAFISDQTPPVSDIRYWTKFLNQDTPMYMGAEKIAERYDMAVMFFHIKKVSRGHYVLSPELLFEHTAGLPDHIITEAHVKRLEEIIKENPQYWIWTHRRWKHKKPADA
ncbi:MAG TPA: lysophospholipid acyltransferase family protein [Bacteroidales bacterium]|nr:lysophospholipid acyltransferase family protein [Bacteroidales bacterium]